MIIGLNFTFYNYNIDPIEEISEINWENMVYT